MLGEGVAPARVPGAAAAPSDGVDARDRDPDLCSVSVLSSVKEPCDLALEPVIGSVTAQAAEVKVARVRPLLLSSGGRPDTNGVSAAACLPILKTRETAVLV